MFKYLLKDFQLDYLQGFAMKTGHFFFSFFFRETGKVHSKLSINGSVLSETFIIG